MKPIQTSKALTGLLSVLLALGLIALVVGVFYRQPSPQGIVVSSSHSPAPGTVTPLVPTAISQAIITPQATFQALESAQPTAVTRSVSPQPTESRQSTALPQDPTRTQVLQATSIAIGPTSVAVTTVAPQVSAIPGGGASPGQNVPPTAVAAGTNIPENPSHTVPGTGGEEPKPVLTPPPLLPSGQNPGSNAGGHAGGDASINTPQPAPKLPQAPPPPTIVTVKATPKPKPGQIVLPNGVIYGERKPNLPNRIVRIASPNIKLDTPVYEVYAPKGIWEVADYAAGHNYNSKNPGEGGNIVLAGHNNWRGEVFRYVVDLKPGDLIKVWTLDGKELHYTVESVNKLLEAGVSYAQRLKNAKVMDPTPNERLTLITCWPYTTFTHRVIVVARPSP